MSTLTQHNNTLKQRLLSWTNNLRLGRYWYIDIFVNCNWVVT